MWGHIPAGEGARAVDSGLLPPTWLGQGLFSRKGPQGPWITGV